MISFEVSKEIENYVCFVLSRAWDKKKILSPHEELHLRPLDSTPQCSTTEPQRLHGYKVHMKKKLVCTDMKQPMHKNIFEN